MYIVVSGERAAPLIIITLARELHNDLRFLYPIGYHERDKGFLILFIRSLLQDLYARTMGVEQTNWLWLGNSPHVLRLNYLGHDKTE